MASRLSNLKLSSVFALTILSVLARSMSWRLSTGKHVECIGNRTDGTLEGRLFAVVSANHSFLEQPVDGNQASFTNLEMSCTCGEGMETLLESPPENLNNTELTVAQQVSVFTVCDFLLCGFYVMKWKNKQRMQAGWREVFY